MPQALGKEAASGSEHKVTTISMKKGNWSLSLKLSKIRRSSLVLSQSFNTSQKKNFYCFDMISIAGEKLGELVSDQSEAYKLSLRRR